MQADVLLVYTMATTLQVDGHTLDPAHKLSLGDQPEVGATVNSTASLAFVDVRTGYVYATTQADAAMTDLADAWQSETALDAKRMAAEQKAFAALLVVGQASWSGSISRGLKGGGEGKSGGVRLDHG